MHFIVCNSNVKFSFLYRISRYSEDISIIYIFDYDIQCLNVECVIVICVRFYSCNGGDGDGGVCVWVCLTSGYINMLNEQAKLGSDFIQAKKIYTCDGILVFQKMRASF